MNYFAHAYRFLDDPYFVLGSGVPDWLSVVDRKVRVRNRLLEPFIDDADPVQAAIARGAMQHIEEDRRFHQSRAFTEVNAQLAMHIRDSLPTDSGFRPSFLAHLLSELLLDDWLIREHPGRIETYYEILAQADLQRVERSVNRMATGTTNRLAWLIERFGQARVLSEYADDSRLFHRVNQVMGRVGFEPLPDGFRNAITPMRELVDRRAVDLAKSFL